MLWEALGHEPPVWGHVPLLVNEQRKKISKRRDKVALESYRDEGYLAEAMVNYLMTLGWSPGDTEIVPWSTIEDAFRLEDVSLSPAFFDLKKLAAFNGEYVRAMTVDAFVAACEPWLEQWRRSHPDARWDQDVFVSLAEFVQVRVSVLSDAPGVLDFMFLPEPQFDEASLSKALAVESATQVVADTVEAYSTCAWTTETLKGEFERVAERYGLKLGKAQAPVRVAVTGRMVGPPLFEALELLGREEVLRRLRGLPEGVQVG
jgi:glutamyl-tRNA synthetase